MLSRIAGPDDTGHIFAFVIGAGVAFAGLNALVTRGFQRRVDTEPPVVLALATSFSLVSISGGVGIAILLGKLIGGWAAWLLGSLLSSWTYLGISALEVAIARTLHLAVGDTDAEDR